MFLRTSPCIEWVCRHIRKTCIAQMKGKSRQRQAWLTEWIWGRTFSSMVGLVIVRLRSRPMSSEWRPRPRCLPWARRRAGSERHLPLADRSKRSSLSGFAGRCTTCITNNVTTNHFPTATPTQLYVILSICSSLGRHETSCTCSFTP